MGKSFVASKTNWGVILMLLPVLLKSLFGIDIDQSLLNDTSNFIELGMQLAGGALALYGRWKAKLPLNWNLPKLPGSTLGLFLACVLVLGSGNLLVGCVTAAPGSQSTVQVARQSAAIALTVYVKGYQPALLAYSKLEVCPHVAPPCLDSKLYGRLYYADGAATSCIAAVQPILQSEFPDFDIVARCLQRIEDAKRIFAEGGLKPVAFN